MYLDIQGAEETFVPSIVDVLNAKVLRIIIGTHKPRIHESLLSVFKEHGWILIWAVGMKVNFNRWNCLHEMNKYIRGFDGKHPARCHWKDLLKTGCWHLIPRGPIANFDGELILDNPRFVQEHKVFSMEDTTLKIHDLRPVSIEGASEQ